MKKLLFISHSSETSGGAELEFKRILQVIKKYHENVIVDCLMPEGSGLNEIRDLANEVHLYTYGFLPVVYKNFRSYLRYLYISFYQILQIRKVLKNEHYDLCVLNVSVLIIPAIYLKIRGLKNIFLIKEKVEPKFARYILYKLINYSSIFVFFNSLKLKIDYEIITGSNNVMHLYTSVYINENDSEIDIDEKLEVNKDKLNIICIGDITERKNQELLLNAYTELLDSKDHVFFHFVGEYNENSHYYKKLKSIIELNDLIPYTKFYGRLDIVSLRYLLKQIDIVVISSLSEGIPYILFDALKFKKVIIATNVGGISEVIENESNGILIPIEHKILAQKIDLIHNNAALKKKIEEKTVLSIAKFNNSENQLKIMIQKILKFTQNKMQIYLIL